MSRLGLVVYHGIESGAELAEYGRIAEGAGFDSLWVTERYFHEETFSLLGYLAAVTRTLRLGVGVVNPYTRNPALLAMAAATLDRLSGGRLVLGLGRSEPAVIQDKMGIRYGKAGAAMEGAVSLLGRLLAGQRYGRSVQSGQRQAVARADSENADLSGRHRPQGPEAGRRHCRRSSPQRLCADQLCGLCGRRNPQCRAGRRPRPGRD